VVDVRGHAAQSVHVRRPEPPDPSQLTPAAARALVLRWLGQRELTTAQLRLRLRRRHCPEDTIAETLAALTADGAIDDRRAAAARARHDVAIRRRGPARVLRQVEALGVDRDTAREAVAAAFEDLDQDAMIDDALDRRLRARPFPADRAALARLYGWLVRQGFDPDKVSARLRRRGRDAAST
jgi:SOS response regulatory protein OraA/RecX